jgi:four helix bundle protein
LAVILVKEEMMTGFKDLSVYNKALDVVKEVYDVSKKFPKEEIFGLTNQIRRAVTSIVLNIAEGSGCESSKEFSKFLNYALRSKHEVIACLDISEKLEYTNNNDSYELKRKLEEISSMIVGLSRSLKRTK